MIAVAPTRTPMSPNEPSDLKSEPREPPNEPSGQPREPPNERSELSQVIIAKSSEPSELRQVS